LKGPACGGAFLSGEKQNHKNSKKSVSFAGYFKANAYKADTKIKQEDPV